MLQDARATPSTEVNVEFRFGEVTERRVEVNTGCQHGRPQDFFPGLSKLGGGGWGFRPPAGSI